MANKHLGRAKPSSNMFKRGYTIHLVNKLAKPQEAPTVPPPAPPKKDEEKG